MCSIRSVPHNHCIAGRVCCGVTGKGTGCVLILSRRVEGEGVHGCPRAAAITAHAGNPGGITGRLAFGGASRYELLSHHIDVSLTVIAHSVSSRIGDGTV